LIVRRRSLLAGLGGAVVAGLSAHACAPAEPAPARASRGRSEDRDEAPLAARPPSGRPDSAPIFENFHRSLVNAHGELRAGLGAILTSAQSDDPRGTDPLIGAFCEELLDHHHAEDAFFFPAFRAAGRLRSSDVAFLDARDSEHRDVHRLCLELRDISTAHRRAAVDDRTWLRAVARLAGELSAISRPHFAIEESTLTGQHVATMIAPSELVAVYRDMGENWHRR
jgi:hypothetical protein